MPDISKARKHDPVAGLVLAAGASTRMGAPKQLLPAGDVCLLDRILAQTLRSRLDLVVLVLGSKADEVRRRIRSGRGTLRLKIVENRDYEKGISASIITGLSHAERNFDHVMILLGDMPYITSRVINRLLAGYLESGLPLGALKVRGKRSHPVIIGRTFFAALHRLKGDRGAKDLFTGHQEQVCLVEPGENYDDTDIDTYEDYLRFKKTLESRQGGRSGIKGRIR
jgi:molybdenum cofactor cytidylyltransferase